MYKYVSFIFIMNVYGDMKTMLIFLPKVVWLCKVLRMQHILKNYDTNNQFFAIRVPWRAK